MGNMMKYSLMMINENPKLFFSIVINDVSARSGCQYRSVLTSHIGSIFEMPLFSEMSILDPDAIEIAHANTCEELKLSVPWLFV